MTTENKVTEIFCIAVDFCKVFDAQMEKYTINGHKACNRQKTEPCWKGNLFDLIGNQQRLL